MIETARCTRSSPAAALRVKALLVVALALAAVCLALTTWALLERSGRLSAKVQVVTLRAQTDILADALKRCNDGVGRLESAGKEAVAMTRENLRKAQELYAKNGPLLADIRGILGKPPPTRADGKPKDCGDALTEIRAKVKP